MIGEEEGIWQRTVLPGYRCTSPSTENLAGIPIGYLRRLAASVVAGTTVVVVMVDMATRINCEFKKSSYLGRCCARAPVPNLRDEDAGRLLKKISALLGNLTAASHDQSAAKQPTCPSLCTLGRRVTEWPQNRSGSDHAPGTEAITDRFESVGSVGSLGTNLFASSRVLRISTSTVTKATSDKRPIPKNFVRDRLVVGLSRTARGRALQQNWFPGLWGPSLRTNLDRLLRVPSSCSSRSEAMK